MAKLRLSKGELQRQREQLALYEKLLPSLDLKRRQLTVELTKARGEYEESRKALDQLESRISAEVPMIAGAVVDMAQLVRVTGAVLGEENVVGVRLPVLEQMECEVVSYSLLAKPAWLDVLVQRLRDAAEHRTRVQVVKERVRILEKAEKRVTQRVNLFDRILIPDAKANIQRIRIFLGDQERSAVVSSKLAKAKQQKVREGAGGAS